MRGSRVSALPHGTPLPTDGLVVHADLFSMQGEVIGDGNENGVDEKMQIGWKLKSLRGEVGP